ncbi:Cytochrome likeTBP [Capsicum annuum]|nr:Cytochrome likeTBP [Capsicum annuum]
MGRTRRLKDKRLTRVRRTRNTWWEFSRTVAQSSFRDGRKNGWIGWGGTNRSDKGLNLSGSWQQGHSATYNTPSKRSLVHAFTVRIPHEIYVLVELILGHLRYLLTDVPPQSNSPPDNVFRLDRPAEWIPFVRTNSELAVQRAGKATGSAPDTTRRAVLFQPLDPTFG